METTLDSWRLKDIGKKVPVQLLRIGSKVEKALPKKDMFLVWKYAPPNLAYGCLTSQYHIAKFRARASSPFFIGVFIDIPYAFDVNESRLHIRCTNHLVWGFVINQWRRLIHAIDSKLTQLGYGK